MTALPQAVDGPAADARGNVAETSVVQRLRRDEGHRFSSACSSGCRSATLTWQKAAGHCSVNRTHVQEQELASPWGRPYLESCKRTSCALWLTGSCRRSSRGRAETPIFTSRRSRKADQSEQRNI